MRRNIDTERMARFHALWRKRLSRARTPADAHESEEAAAAWTAGHLRRVDAEIARAVRELSQRFGIDLAGEGMGIEPSLPRRRLGLAQSERVKELMDGVSFLLRTRSEDEPFIRAWGGTARELENHIENRLTARERDHAFVTYIVIPRILHGDDAAAESAAAWAFAKTGGQAKRREAQAVDGEKWAEALVGPTYIALRECEPEQPLSKFDELLYRIRQQLDRKKKVDTVYTTPDDLPEASTEEPGYSVIDARDFVRVAKEKLDEKEIKALTLCAEGMTYTEIGAALKVPAGSVGKLLKRARMNAKRLLAPPD
jgi:DNA-directed RNA polymerase specialized sigma24 family protein